MKIDYPFTNHMVVQRNKKVTITGQSAQDIVTMTFLGQQYISQVINGKWSVSFMTSQVGGPYEMTFVSENEKIIFDDILVGDVYLAAGQSNMEWKMGQTPEKQLPKYKDNVRVLQVPQYVYPFEEKEEEWKGLNAETISDFSSLASYFTYYLEEDIPIGIISNNKGGTSASCWISEEYLKKDQTIYQVYYQDYYQDLPTVEKQKENMQDYFQKFECYQREFETFQNHHPDMSLSEIKNIVGHTPWPPPKGIYDFGKPSGLYENMFQKTVHYPIQAVLWYQGEEDSPRYMYYERLLSLLIENWRHDYHEDIPFFIVQLPEYKNSHFNEIRLAQRNVSLKTENVYLVVSLGTGDVDYIHPTCKRELGKRLANSVEYYIYHRKKSICPSFQKIIEDEKEIRLIFDQPLQMGQVHFVIDDCEEIGKIEKNTVVIPFRHWKCITYGCYDNPQIEIASENGFPCSPFYIQK